MQNTKNYSLLLPDGTDFYNVDDYNANFEAIDTQMKSNQTKADNVTANHNSHVANKSNPHGVTKEQVGLGNVPNVTTNNQTPTYTVPGTLTAAVSGETVTTAFGKFARAVSDLISHLGNKNNPHGVTKAQIGLGSVPDVSTNDQTPTYSDTATLATLVSGEKLNVALQKTKLAISRLITHLSDTVSHITSAERSSWNGKADASLLNSRIPQYFNVKSQAELDAVMNDYSANLAINSYYNFTLSVAVGNLSIMGGSYFVEGMKTSADYEWQRITKYPNGNALPPLLISGRSKFAGVWSAWENVAMKSELTSVKGNAESSYRIGQVNITPANIGLGNVNNTADSAKNVLSASKLTTPRTISLAGDVSGSVSFDGSGNVSMTTAIADDSHNHTIANVDGLQAALDSKADSFFSVSIYDMAQGRLQFAWNDATMDLIVLIDGYSVGNINFGGAVG